MNMFESTLQDPVWSFTGREEELKAIHATMQVKAEEATMLSRMAVISGKAGMGKSELARKYVYKYRGDYDGNIVWINSETFEDFETAFKTLAKEELKIPISTERGDRNIESIVKDVYRYFYNSKSLFIFDNVEKYESDSSEIDKDVDDSEKNVGWVSQLLLFGNTLLSTDEDKYLLDIGIERFIPLSSPPDSRPYILIVSRNRVWLNGVTVIVLKGLKLNDAVSFVKTSLNIAQWNQSQDKEIEMLVKITDNYPLALQLAVAYIGNQNVNLSDYLKKYKEKSEELFRLAPDSRKFKGIDNYTKNILTASECVTDKIAEDSKCGKLALDILNVVAYFPPENIKKEIFLNLAGRNPEKLNSAVELLVKFSMVSGRKHRANFDVQRAVQRSTKIKLREENKEKEVLREVLKLFRDNIKETNLDYVMSAWKLATRYESLVKEFGELPSQIISKLEEDIRSTEDELFGIESLELVKGILGFDDPTTFRKQNNSASALHEQGKYNEAFNAYQELFEKSKKLLGPEHPHTLDHHHNMAVELFGQGKYNEAFDIFREVFDIQRRVNVFGPDHPKTLITRQNMALVLSNQGMYRESHTVFQEVCIKSAKTLGPEHPLTLNSRYNLAGLFSRQGKYSEAFNAYKEIYEIRQKMGDFGPDHPKTLSTLHNMATVLLSQGKYSESFGIYQEILGKREALLGPEHPETLTTRHNMVELLCKQGKYTEAFDAYQKIFDIERRPDVLGPEHPLTVSTLHNMALVLANQGKLSECINVYQEVYKLQEKTVGPEHPDTITTRHNIAGVLSVQGKYDESFCAYQDILEKRGKNLGPDHPLTLTTRHNIATVLSKQGKYSEAFDVYQDVFEKRKEVLGLEHPDTANTFRCLEKTRRKLKSGCSI